MSIQSRFLIGAANSGSGKTTLTIGLLKALANRGFNIQPFKCGPDYIDTKFHEAAASNPSVNLDLFLSSTEHVRYLYNKYASGKDICIIEGVMGLYDGYKKMQGSSAEIAELLDIPVILVVNAKSMAYSAAALIYGFKEFYPGINVAGVIFNFVGSESHYSFLEDACKDAGVEPLGYLPKDREIETPSRHLGLSLDGQSHFDNLANKIAGLIEKTVDIDRLLKITSQEINLHSHRQTEQVIQNLNITVAQDAAFNFVYHENIEYLKRLGNVSFFSPLKDKILPATDLLYLPGGYPELYVDELSNNKPMKECIRAYIENGGKALAECGGMMYLSDSITDTEGKIYPMTGILGQKATMQNMKLKLGYRQFRYNNVDIKGHEFHYSSIEKDDKDLQVDIEIQNAKGQPTGTKLFRYKNLIAGYTHVYWSEMDNLLDLFK
ncbi:MAG: cobyrinate a,c-diamide synthase [Prevotella sp.]|jgi:cobyrinic acid a,c-diamide synthase|nr:cobyrinate a,c-diamide synthase [Prevotella sp.]